MYAFDREPRVISTEEMLAASKFCPEFTLDTVYSRSAEKARAFAEKWGAPHWTDSLEALAGKSVAVQNGSYAEELLSGDYADLAATFSEVLGFDEYLTALMDLQNGGCDAVLMDLVVGDYRINGMGATDLKAAVALTDDNYGIGLRKEDIALRDKVEELLIEMKKDGTLEKISTQWFGSDITVVPAE